MIGKNMKNIKNYNLFIFENSIEMIEIFNDADILESIVTDSDSLLKSIKAEEVDLYQTFELNPDEFETDFDIEFLYDDNDFNKRLDKMNLLKNTLESSEENETFIDKTVIIKFFSVYNKNKSELDQPKYIIYQSKQKGKDWENVKCYAVNDNMKNFYDKLTNKTIEIKKKDKTYVYQTSNSGNDWILQKHEDDQENKIFKDNMSNDDIRAILTNDDTSITIIA